MLPAYRVIGHKEYGNTPPGGWDGRKTDPVYDMNWRRDRVANFVPRTGTTNTGGFLMALNDAEQAELLNLARNLAGFLYKGGPDVNGFDEAAKAGRVNWGTVMGRAIMVDRVTSGAQGHRDSVSERLARIEQAIAEIRGGEVVRPPQ